jgi:hypothetical protein
VKIKIFRLHDKLIYPPPPRLYILHRHVSESIYDIKRPAEFRVTELNKLNHALVLNTILPKMFSSKLKSTVDQFYLSRGEQNYSRKTAINQPGRAIYEFNLHMRHPCKKGN